MAINTVDICEHVELWYPGCSAGKYMVLPGELELLMATTACRRTGCQSPLHCKRVKSERWLQVASPFAGRVHPATRRTVGCCINTLAMRTRLQGLATLGELVAAVRGTALAAYRNAEASLHTIMQAMGRCPEESLFSVRSPLQTRAGARQTPCAGRPASSSFSTWLEARLVGRHLPAS